MEHPDNVTLLARRGRRPAPAPVRTRSQQVRELLQAVAIVLFLVGGVARIAGGLAEGARELASSLEALLPGYAGLPRLAGLVEVCCGFALAFWPGLAAGLGALWLWLLGVASLLGGGASERAALLFFAAVAMLALARLFDEDRA